MRLGWDEIRRRAKQFSDDWQHAHYEKGETHSFYNAFFEIFGVNRRALDSAVDKLYRPQPFASDRDRVEHLFGRYEVLVNPLERLGIAKNKRVARKAQQKP